MKSYLGNISKDVLSLFASDIGCREFFSYTGNMVSLEQAIAVLGCISPDFIEADGCVFWTSDARLYDTKGFELVGLVETSDGILKKSNIRRDVERYKNFFSINQFFSKWEEAPGRPLLKVGLSEADYRLCYVFAGQLMKYWGGALSNLFPDKKFEFEIAENLLGEYGICLTFWQD